MAIKCPKCQTDNPSDAQYCKECASPLTAESKKESTETITRTRTLNEDQQVRPLENIGPYKILEVLGSGGLGTVYLAQQEKPIKRKVALKIIKPGMNSEEIIGRFESEQQALALMNHPNIAQVYDSGTTEQGYPYFVMEYVPGLSITEYCDRHKLTTRERLTLFQELCNAVQHAHYKGIVHRDLKPSNVLVTFQNDKHVPKVIDFGIAKALTGQGLTEKTLYTLHNVAIGTPAYMSPEQAELTGYDIDTRTDVYSLGILLYELLVGVTPFDEHELERAGLAEILRIIREVEPPKPTTRFNSLGETSNEVAEKRGTTPVGMLKQLKGDLECILMKAVEKDRKRRYSSAAELSEDINRFLGHKPIHAHPPNISYKLKKFVRRHKSFSFAATLMLLLIITFSLWNVLERRRAETASKEANNNYALTLIEKAKGYSADSEWPLAKLFCANSKFYQIKAKNSIPLKEIELPEKSQDLVLVNTILFSSKASDFSPDGKFIFFLDDSGSIKQWDLSRGKITNFLGDQFKSVFSIKLSSDGRLLALSEDYIILRIYDLALHKIVFSTKADIRSPIIIPKSIDFISNGKYLVAVCNNGTIKKWDVQSGNEFTILKVPPVSVNSVNFSPDGKYLAFEDFKKKIKILEVASGKEVSTFQGDYGSANSTSFSPDGKYLASGSDDTLVRVWEISTGKIVKSFHGHKSSVISASFSPNGKYLVSRSLDNVIKIWDIEREKIVCSLRGIEGIFLQDGKLIAIKDRVSGIKIWEIPHEISVRTIKKEPAFIGLLSYSPDGKLLAFDSGKSIKIYELFDYTEYRTLTGHQDRIETISFSPDGKYLATGSWDKSLKIWDISSGREHASINMPGPLIAVSFSPDGKCLAAGSLDGIIRIWQVDNAKEIASFRRNLFIGKLDYSLDGSHLINTMVFGISTLDISTGKWNPVLRTKGVASISLSPDRKCFALTESRVGTIEIWNLDRSAKLITLKGHNMDVTSMSFSPDGEYLASGSLDKTLRIWELSSGNEIANLKENEKIYAISYSPDGKYLAFVNRESILIMNLESSIYYFRRELDSLRNIREARELLEQVEIQTGYLTEGNTPLDAYEYGNIGSEYSEKGKYDQAIAAYEKALKLDPKFILALKKLGKIYFQKGNYHLALNSFKKVIEIDKWDIDSQFDIGLTYLALDDFENAYHHVTQKINLYTLKNIHLLILGKINDVNKLLEIYPQKMFAYLYRGYLYATAYYPIKAKEDLEKFIAEFKGEDKWRNIAKELLANL